MTVRVDSIAGEDGTSPVTLTGQEAVRSHGNTNDAQTSIVDSLNMSSWTDTSTGVGNWTMTSAHSAVDNTCLGGQASGNGRIYTDQDTTSRVLGYSYNSSEAVVDCMKSCGVFGDLA